jgi:hypothetical protein
LISDRILVPVHQLFTAAMLLEVSITQVTKADLDYTQDCHRIDLAGFDTLLGGKTPRNLNETT